MPLTPPTAILLAAGRARRLGSITDGLPKCLLEVGGRTLIEHQIAALREAGVRRIVVVTGYYAERVTTVCGRDVVSVENTIYDRTNSLYSLSLALQHGREGFVLTNADVLFDPELLRRLVDSPHADALLYEPNLLLGDEEMKVRLDGDTVTAMSKDLPAGSFHGENLGVLKFSAAGYRALAPVVRTLIAQNDVNAWAPKAFDTLCRDFPLHAVPTTGLPWIEIDFPADYDRAREITWPRIAARRGQRAGEQAAP